VHIVGKGVKNIMPGTYFKDNVRDSGIMVASEAETFRIMSTRFTDWTDTEAYLMIVLRSPLTILSVVCDCMVLKGDGYPQINSMNITVPSMTKEIRISISAQKILVERLTPIIKELIKQITKE
jgi:hypothetical protein